ncbi:MAG: hypothetical protein ACK448_06000 [Bacteroidota bacterium]
MSNLELIWQTSEGEQTSFELEYICDLLFKDIPHHRNYDDKNYSTVLNNAIIIYSNNQRGPDFDFINYLNKFKKNNFTFYLWHLSNESLLHNCEYYSLAKHVFRSYYYRDLSQNDSLTYLPLGFKSGYLNRSNNFDITNKTLAFSFIGQPKSDRIELIEVLNNLKDSFIHTTNSWNCTNALTQTECKQIYQQSRFVPCPKGWINPDSFRIMEALESGSIPIIKEYDDANYFNIPWEINSPIPMVKEWADIEKYSNLSDLEYNAMYKEVFQWYSNFRLTLKNRILQHVNL